MKKTISLISVIALSTLHISLSAEPMAPIMQLINRCLEKAEEAYQKHKEERPVVQPQSYESELSSKQCSALQVEADVESGMLEAPSEDAPIPAEQPKSAAISLFEYTTNRIKKDIETKIAQSDLLNNALGRILNKWKNSPIKDAALDALKKYQIYTRKLQDPVGIIPSDY